MIIINGKRVKNPLAQFLVMLTLIPVLLIVAGIVIFVFIAVGGLLIALIPVILVAGVIAYGSKKRKN